MTAVRVGRLTVRPARAGRGRDAAARQRAESLIGSLDLRPPGITDHAVLVLRQVRWRADRRLPETARAAVDALWRSAARPGLGPAPDPDAQAVLFADESELLACLTRDTLDGTLSRWYWRLLAPAGASRVGAVLASAWVARARWVPSALASMPAGDAIRAVSTLTLAEAGYVLRAVLAEFGVSLAAPDASVAGSDARSAPPGGPRTAGTAMAGRGTPVPRRPAADADELAPGDASTTDLAGGVAPLWTSQLSPWTPQLPPWAPWLPPYRIALTPAQEALLGVALALHAAPALVRRPAFPAQAQAWLRAALATGATPSVPPTLARPAERLARASEAPVPEVPRGSPDAVAPDATDVVTGAGARRNANDASTSLTSANYTNATDASCTNETSCTNDASYTNDASARRSGDPDSGGTPHAATVPRPMSWAGGVPSRFASALFLVNMLDWLDLPTTWPEDAIPSGWAVVDLLARHLLAHHLLGESSAADVDPLWTLLAELDGREPGAAADVPVGPEDPVRLPTGWLRRWAPAPANWAWSAYHGRVVLIDSERGFVVADVPYPVGQARATASTELARLHAAELPGSLRRQSPAPQRPRGTDGGPARWGAAVGQFVAWLLAVREVPTEALARPGRIVVTRTHVDVVLDLEDVDMAARICGLDRDPGWVPDLGRIVAFHFEARG